MNTNIRKFDKGFRIALGSAAILSVLSNPFTPAWFAIAGAYAVLTSLLSWDPAYAAVYSVFGGRDKGRHIRVGGTLANNH
jgi:hypothetical protein